MIDDLLTKVVARFAELTADLRFDHKPTGIKKAPEIIVQQQPYPDQDYHEAEEFPRIRIAVVGFAARGRRQLPSFSLIARGGIYTAGTIAAGTSDILTLAEAMMAVADKPSFPPFRLAEDCPGRIGDPQAGMEGMQPHPYHFVELRMDFNKSFSGS